MVIVYGLDLIEQERDGNESYYSVDGLGSTRGLTDENGQVTDSYVYDAYGNVVGVAGTTENDYLFAGEQFDGTLGQYYLRQRYYDPNSGRFTRRDTYEGRLENPVSLHKYLYANANPVSYVDPSGLNAAAMEQSLVLALVAIFATLSYLSYNYSQSGVGFGSQQAIDDFLDLFVPNFAAQRGKQGDAGDSGIRQEAEGLLRDPNYPEIDTIEKALEKLMKEAKQANNGKGDTKRIQRIKKEQKAQKIRKSRQKKDRK